MIAVEKTKRKIHWIEIRQPRIRMALMMFSADLLGFIGAALFSLLLLYLGNRTYIFRWNDLRYLAIVFICLIFYFSSKLYPGIGLNPADELRLIFTNTSIGFLLGVFMFRIMQSNWFPNYLALFPFAFLGMIFVIAMRWWMRIIGVQRGVWGEPVVVIGSSSHAGYLAHYFLDRRRLGFIPAYIVTDPLDSKDSTLSIPIFDKNDLLTCPEDYFSSQQINTALIDISNMPELLNSHTFRQLSQLFPKLVIISSLSGMEGSFMQVHDFEGIVGLEVARNVFSPLDTFTKRTMDVVLSFLLLVFTSPIWLLAILLIRLDSKGPIFYTQPRVGRNRRSLHDKSRLMGHVNELRIYKLRTMVVNAEHILDEYLDSDPQAREEWNRTQKLRDDPRITRVGNWLRKYSIDELPQLINVLKGEMSLVGPRPIMLDQVSQYGDKIDAYHSVRPGLTGLWQVSGRNLTSFEERTGFDYYYVGNWSVWLDVYILIRTVRVVLTRHGAY